MSTKVAEPIEAVVEVCEKEKKVVEEEKEEIVDEDSKSSESGDAKENGDAEKTEKEKCPRNGDKATEEVEADKACVKRKSEAADVTEGKPAEGATPEKKAKLDEAAEAESNGKAEVAA